MLTLEKLKKQVEEHFNEVVINYGFNVVRLVGYAETNDDYYYIVKNPNGKEQYTYLSCVGEPIFLKGKLNETEYNSLDNMLAVNGCAKEEVLLEKMFDVKTEEEVCLLEFKDAYGISFTFIPPMIYDWIIDPTQNQLNPEVIKVLKENDGEINDDALSRFYSDTNEKAFLIERLGCFYSFSTSGEMMAHINKNNLVILETFYGQGY